ncbi:MAG: TlpA family protein disulfide reductase [Chitinophagaceae bacterium]|nr:MAG: TlpA family protein disulfide reductase [Chitinophagaceae bacterium]
MNIKILIFLVLCSFFTFITFCQQIQIRLTDKIGISSIGQETFLGEKVKDISGYTGFDSLKYKQFVIKKITFYQLQNDVEYMILKNTPVDKVKGWLIKYGDTSYVSYRSMPKNHVAFLDAVDSYGRIHFIMDANNNHRFDDDKEYVFDTADIKKEYPLVHANFEYYDGKNLKQITVPYRVNAYAYLNPIIYAYANHADTLKSTRLDFQSYKEGIYQSGKSKFVFHLVNKNMFVYKNNSFDIAVQPVTNKKNINDQPFIYKSTDLMEFNTGLYKIDSLSNNILYLNLVEKLQYGGNIGAMASLIEGKDIMNGSYFDLKKKRKNYILINFWGSWCAPCIKELPALKELHKKYKNVSFLSIATDFPKDTVKLKTLIQEKKLSWPQLWIHRDTKKQDLLWDYKITAYPTTILIDPEGKIVLRGTGSAILTEIDHYLGLKKLY